MKTLINELIEKEIDYINIDLEKVNMRLRYSAKHVKQRILERDISISDVAYAIRKFGESKLCELIHLTSLNEKFKPYRIQVRSEQVILTLALRDNNTWLFTTVLDPKIHNKHSDKKSSLEEIIHV